MDVESSSLWHGRQYLFVDGPRTITVPIWPAGILTGRVISKARRAPTEVNVGFEGTAGPNDPVSGTSTGKIAPDGRFTIRLPLGTMDVRMRAARHIGRFFWSLSITSRPKDLGDVNLVEGQAIVGRVDLPSGIRADVTKVVVRARPNGTTDGSGPFLTGSLFLPRSTTVEKKGIFHLDGVMPGEYIVQATHPSGFVSSEVVVPVREGVAAVDLTEPLQLNEPKKVGLSITPPATPDGSRWRIAIARVVGPSRYDPIAITLTGKDGSWESPPLAPGEYRITAGTSFDDAWYEDQITLGASDEVRSITLKGRRVEGRLLMGEKPLQGNVEFHESGGRTVTADAPDGSFTVTLPDPDRTSWDVTVRSQAPFVNRTFAGFSVPRDVTRVTISVPNTLVTGKVIDEHSNPLPNALITVVSGTSVIQPTAAPDGIFQVYGLVEGSYQISASTADEVADSINVDLHEDDPAQTVTLVAHKRNQFRSQVLSPLGPVAGASVFVRPTNPIPSLLPILSTGADGVFESTIPHGAVFVDVIAMPPGFTFFLGRLRVEDDKPVAVTQRGGVIEMYGPESESYVVHGGAAVELEMIENLWPVRREKTAGGAVRVHAPMMEPGIYALCTVPPSRKELFLASGGATGATQCATGALDPLGSLTLRLPSSD